MEILWFPTQSGDPGVGRMSPSGVVTEFPIGSLDPNGYWNVANGPNGSLIVTAQNRSGLNEVYRLSTSGAVTPYKIPATISKAFYTYLGAADGSLWFTGATNGKIGRITAGGVAMSGNLSIFSRFPNQPTSITVGRDGNIYLLDGNGTVYRLSPKQLAHGR